jgi:PadR family transcriptional regulator PadR
MDDVRLTSQSLRVLKAFLGSAKPLAGIDLMDAARLSSGTLYPILIRLERVGVLESEWEELDPAAVKRPRRRFYRLTREGRRFAKDALADVSR